MTVMDDWCLFTLDENIPMKDKYRKEANLIDSQKPIMVAKKEATLAMSDHAKCARIFFDKDRHEHILMLTSSIKECACFVATPAPHSLGHYMHLADMFLTDDDWEEKLYDSAYMDEFGMRPVFLRDAMIDYGVTVNREVADEMYPNDHSDPLDYHFGESACNVFERWSNELKKMRDAIKNCPNKKF